MRWEGRIIDGVEITLIILLLITVALGAYSWQQALVMFVGTLVSWWTLRWLVLKILKG